MSTTTAARPPASGPGNMANSQWPSGHPRRRLILLVLCLSLLVVVIDNTILNTALPTLARALHAGTSSLQWITDAYTLCFAALLIPAGALGDRHGRRLSLLGGLAVFALGRAAAARARAPGPAGRGGDRLDILGAVLIGGALFAIVDAIIEAPARGWTGTATLAETAAGLAALAVFAWWELRIAHPLVDLRIFASRAFSTAAASVTVIFFALFGSLFVLTQYLQLVHGYSPLSAGLRALPLASRSSAASPPPSTGPGSPMCSPRGTRPARSPTWRPARSPRPTASAGTSADCRAASWSAPRTAPSSTRWPWACASPPASP